MPTKVQNAQAWIKLQREFGILGRHKMLLDEVVVPTVVIADLSEDDAALNNLVQYRFSVPAVVATVGKAILFNGVTADSGRDIIIDRIVGSCAVTSPWMVHHTTNAPITPIAASTLDQTFAQWPQVGVPIGRMFADSGAITGDDIVSFRTQGGTVWEIAVGSTR